ncbi:MAG: hypothetical protein QM690_01090 [Sphingobium sp.]
MTGFTHRNQPVASVASVTERVSAVRAIAPLGQPVSRTDAWTAPPQGDAPASSGDETARARADYARINRDIADVLDSVGAQRPGRPPATAAEAESALLSLLPQPTAILPLPPADEDMVAFVAQVAQAIARQAAQTRAALSGVAPAVVDAVIAA